MNYTSLSACVMAFAAMILRADAADSDGEFAGYHIYEFDAPNTLINHGDKIEISCFKPVPREPGVWRRLNRPNRWVDGFFDFEGKGNYVRGNGGILQIKKPVSIAVRGVFGPSAELTFAKPPKSHTVSQELPLYPPRFERKMMINGEEVSILITRVRFDPAKHDMKIARDGGQLAEGFPRIDGRIPIGVDGYGIPEEEIDRFEVIWGGTPIEIPKSLYADIYTPILNDINPAGASNLEGVLVCSDSDRRSLLIQMRSWRWVSAPYTVWWIINRNGEQHCFIFGEAI